MKDRWRQRSSGEISKKREREESNQIENVAGEGEVNRDRVSEEWGRKRERTVSEGRYDMKVYIVRSNQ